MAEATKIRNEEHASYVKASTDFKDAPQLLREQSRCSKTSIRGSPSFRSDRGRALLPRPRRRQRPRRSQRMSRRMSRMLRSLVVQR